MCLGPPSLARYMQLASDYQDAAERYAWYCQDLNSLLDELEDNVPGVAEYLIWRIENVDHR